VANQVGSTDEQEDANSFSMTVAVRYLSLRDRFGNLAEYRLLDG
jgi:hypothetical protein